MRTSEKRLYGMVLVATVYVAIWKLPLVASVACIVLISMECIAMRVLWSILQEG